MTESILEEIAQDKTPDDELLNNLFDDTINYKWNEFYKDSGIKCKKTYAP